MTKPEWAKIQQLQRAIETVVRGKPEAVKLALVCLLADGHLLIEDVPGVGKTTLAHSLARVFDCTFRRIQFTSDLLPSDILGVSVFNRQARHSISVGDRSSPILCSPMKSTAQLRKHRARSWRQ